MDSCAGFWLQTWDEQNEGFYTNIDRYGNVLGSWGYNKNMMTQSRNAYGLTRAYMMTGDTTYLHLAEKALSWMYNHAWDPSFGGWMNELGNDGKPLNRYADKTAFYQHYAMLGIAAYYEATRDTVAWNWLIKSRQHLEDFFWDNRNSLEGYYDLTRYNGRNATDKSFNATVDALTTHLIYMYLMTQDDNYKSRLLELAEEIKIHLVASMPQQAIGFVEKYDSDWNWKTNETMTIMGHVLKAGWCLARIYQLFPEQSLKEAAETLIHDVWENAYDHEFGGPYKDYNRITGDMLMWGNPDTAKAWWQMEQAIVAGLQLYDISHEDIYLQMADETIDFYMRHFVDHVYGEVYSDRTRYGAIAWNEAKASGGKAGYHSIETGYYMYLYGNLFYKYNPVTLHYKMMQENRDREFRLTPLAIRNANLTISRVTLNSNDYNNYDANSKVLYVPAGTHGHFEVTFEPVMTNLALLENSQKKDFQLFQNYPNPFNPSTTISYQIDKPADVSLAIYNIRGQHIETLIKSYQDCGIYNVEWDGKDDRQQSVPSGVYLYKLVIGSQSKSRKMMLVK